MVSVDGVRRLAGVVLGGVLATPCARAASRVARRLGASKFSPAYPPFPIISKRLFHSAGSATSNRTSGRICPITRQNAGRAPSAGTSVAEMTENS